MKQARLHFLQMLETGKTIVPEDKTGKTTIPEDETGKTTIPEDENRQDYNSRR